MTWLSGWQARGMPVWPPAPRAEYMIGRGGDPPGSVTRRTDLLRSRSDSLLGVAWSRQFIYVYSFMHLGFFLIDLFSDYKTE